MPAYGQDHRHHVFGDGLVEDAAAVRDGQTAQSNARRENRLDSYGHRVYPAQLGRSTDEPIQRIATKRPSTQQNLHVLQRLIGDALGADGNQSGSGDHIENPLAHRSEGVPSRENRAQGDGQRRAVRPMSRANDCEALGVHVAPLC